MLLGLSFRVVWSLNFLDDNKIINIALITIKNP